MNVGPVSLKLLYACVVFVSPVDSFYWAVVHFGEKLQAIFGLAVLAVEEVKGGVLSECLNVCVCACAFRREMAG